MNLSREAPVRVKVTALGHIQTLIGEKSFKIKVMKPNIVGLIQSLSKKFGEKVRNAVMDQRSGGLLVLILLNDEDIHFIQKNETPIRNGDEITLLPLAAGG